MRALKKVQPNWVTATATSSLSPANPPASTAGAKEADAADPRGGREQRRGD
jgi:hypothetical protein